MIIALIFGFAGGIWRRWLGSENDDPRWLHVAVGYFMCYAAALAEHSWPYALVLAALGTSAFLPAHGSYMVMGGTRPVSDRTFLRPIMHWLFGADCDGTLLYNATGMALRYGIFTAPMGFVMLLAGNGFGLAYAFSGIAVSLCYLGLWFLRDDLPRTRWTDGFTAYGEFALGFILIAGLTV